MSRLLSANAIAAALLLILGSAALYGAVEMGVGTPDVPGAGFFPLLAAVALVALSVSLLVSALRSNDTPAPAADGEAVPSWRSGLAVITGLIVYVPALEWLGFLVATGMLVGLLLAVFGIRRPLPYMLAVPLIAGGSYLLFHMLLGLPLPVGPAGF